MMAERGIGLAHTTILRWVQRYVPDFEKRWNQYARASNLFELGHRSMRSGVAVQRDHPRGSMLSCCLGKEPLGGRYITPLAQEKINRSTLFINRAIEVNPLALYLNVGLIHAPGVTHYRAGYGFAPPNT